MKKSSWKDWNHPDPKISSKIKNPWTRKAYKSTDAEMELRRLGLLKQVWNTDRYQKVRPKYLTAAVAHGLRDIDIDRIFQIIEYDKKPKRKNRYAPLLDGKALLKKWEKTNYTGKIETMIIHIIYKMICRAVVLSLFPVGNILKPAFL